MKPLADCRLYAFLDTAYLRGRDPTALARQLCQGGADLIQIRAKDQPQDHIRLLIEAVLPVTQAAGVRLVVNDHPALAHQTGADLCHLGQEDFFDSGHRHAKDVLPRGTHTGLGLSTHSPEQAARAAKAEPEYVAVGPVYATPTKPGRPPVTLDYVRWAARNISLPWFAIGGLNAESVIPVLEAGARRICVVSAILDTPDPAGACQHFRQCLASFPI